MGRMGVLIWDRIGITLRNSPMFSLWKLAWSMLLRAFVRASRVSVWSSGCLVLVKADSLPVVCGSRVTDTHLYAE